MMTAFNLQDMKYYFCILLLLLIGCVSTKSTLKNIDNLAPLPVLKNNVFVLTEIATDDKYGYNPDYPINVFYKNAVNDSINQQRYLNALAGPAGETISYKKVETCCPFPSKNSMNGGGILHVYHITWPGLTTPKIVYLNSFERSKLMAPKGFTIKKN